LPALPAKIFLLSIDPLLLVSVGNSNKTGSLYQNTRGFVLRGNIDKALGFYSYITDTQERDPEFVNNFTDSSGGLPGSNLFKRYKSNAYDYFDARGGIYFKAGKHFNFSFAYDKLFLGNGYRSLFLSDFSGNYLFLKIDTRFWKIKYENIFAELTASFKRSGDDPLRPKKYLAAHHLSVAVKKNLNIGLFENVVFGRDNGFDLTYLNPVIFYRSAELQLGSPDKATIGIDAKCNIFSTVQLYGQLVINELHINELKNYSIGSWYNKHAFQFGAKYIDAFNIRNLDVQAEMNMVRPFTYSHRDSICDYSNYNQPLAHPLGAGFREFILNIKYQPFPKWNFNAKFFSWKQGLDSAGINFGSNIFHEYQTRKADNGFFIGSGLTAKCLYSSVDASYEFFENMFVDANVSIRNYKIESKPANKEIFYSLALRINMAKRRFEF
jgi:hypothetical protein